ncbi:uncharacterized protein ATNIH1004_004222 [Aspergillus tanneri]|uniref:Uncharacterized protein n=1 Tax=Aspergillus tanneri TaxID=1220188 RepID=A0A5M9N115_9EURO|nr:uncharacterized protein ATNIH1004_004222 [Aspergillus tanneri]KAA8648337.1 hypothetical protein ATNIH1004_004222 [Aspergillus tanneri]
MKHQIAITCVFCDYERLYRNLQVTPHYHICWLAAKQSPNPFYLRDLETRAAEQGFDVTKQTYYWSGETSEWLHKDLEPTSNAIYSPLTPFFISDSGQAEGTYFEYSMSSDIIERYVWQRPDLLHKLEVICEGYCPGSIDWIEDEELPEDQALGGTGTGTGTGDTA